MNFYESLRKEYLEELMDFITKWKQASVKLKDEDAIDESVMELIKINVGDIFYKMFEISYKTACEKSKAVEDVKNFERDKKELYNSYMKFFDKIPSPWKDKMSKDKEHNMMVEYYKEEIKIKTAEDIKNMFIKHYERMIG